MQQSRPRVLLTGFDEFGESLRVLRELLAKQPPALVVCGGQAGGRSAISLERLVINVDDAPLADNAGAQPIDAPVAPGAPAAYFSTRPIKAMLAALQREGLCAEVSQTAGTFVCNHVFYGLMHALDDVVRGLRVALRAALVGSQAPKRGAAATANRR